MTGLGRAFDRRILTPYASSEYGASAGEYALLLAIVAGCAVVALHHLGGHIGHAISNVSTALR
jgi:Flp pilus assembly pilin Flp